MSGVLAAGEPDWTDIYSKDLPKNKMVGLFARSVKGEPDVVVATLTYKQAIAFAKKIASLKLEERV